MTFDAGAGRGYARLDSGRQLHFRYASPGADAGRRPLVCLHCSPMSSRVFEAFLPAIAQDRVAIAFDTPGYGQSDPLSGPPTIEGFADAVLQGVHGLGLGQVDVLGYHTGSAVAVALGLARPERVGRLAIISALMFEATDRAGLETFRQRDQAPIPQRASGLPDYWTFWRNFWRDLPDDEVAWPLFLDGMLRARGQYDGFYAAYAYDFPKAVAALRKPLLVFNPSDDLHEMTQRVEPLLGPDGSILPLPGWTHGFLHAHPQAFAELLRAYLDR